MFDVMHIVKALSLEKVYNFLLSLGIDGINLDKAHGCIICPTICHNRLGEEASHKLYYYDNNKMFHCYTECGNLTIFELYQKFMKLNYQEISLSEAIDYIGLFFNDGILLEDNFKGSINNEKLLLDLSKYKPNDYHIKLKSYQETVLQVFKEYYHPSWLSEGICKRSMRKFNVRFNAIENHIVIPHYDIDGKMIGIRRRALDEEEIMQFGKYRPESVGNILYNHHLMYNLYGIYEHKETIKKYRRVIIFEGEKSVLKEDGFYDNNSISVACCGQNLNKYQIHLLTEKLNVNEIVIAFDKEYHKDLTKESVSYQNKLLEACRKYKNYANMSYIWDKHDLLDYKDSPVDKGKRVYEILLKERIKVK